MSDATAAATRNGAAVGTEMRSLSLLAKSAAIETRGDEQDAAAEGRDVVHAADRIVTLSAAGAPYREPGPDAGGRRASTGERKVLTFPLLTAYLARKYLSYLCAESPCSCWHWLSRSPSRRSPAGLRRATARSWSRTPTAMLTVQVKGVIFGHFDRGKMTVVDYKADTPNALVTVSGAKMDLKGAKAERRLLRERRALPLPERQVHAQVRGHRHRPLRRRQGLAQGRPARPRSTTARSSRERPEGHPAAVRSPLRRLLAGRDGHGRERRRSPTVTTSGSSSSSGR